MYIKHRASHIASGLNKGTIKFQQRTNNKNELVGQLVLEPHGPLVVVGIDMLSLSVLL